MMKAQCRVVATRLLHVPKFCRLSSRFRSSCETHLRSTLGQKTGLKIFNRFTNSTEELTTRLSKTCTWYCCGPTVYDSPHLGHACCYMHFDIIRRIMERFYNLNVIMLMSVTDIDDKIINKANADGVDFREISARYEREFFGCLSSLNICSPTLAVRVSQHMPDIISFIDKIIQNGLGYLAKDGSVYFSVDNYPNYGRLSPAQERESADDKLSNLDFALWKASKPGEPYWESPWGPGRPGWHIECSAMASKYFGSNVDLHSGGIDLLFPHHENEEAQSCAYHGCDQWVNFWLHTGHVHLRNAKMSKSLKNTVLVEDFLKEYSPDHLRTLCMLVPYRNGIDYSPDVMTNATSVYSKIENFLSDCNSFIREISPKKPLDDGIIFQELFRAQEIILMHLSNDFNTSSAMTELLSLISKTTSEMNRQESVGLQSTSLSVIAVSNFVKAFLGKLGFFSSSEDITQSTHIEQILDTSLKLRSTVRDVALSKDFSEVKKSKKALLCACDGFRDDMKAVGVEIKDRGASSSWNLTSSKKSAPRS